MRKGINGLSVLAQRLLSEAFASGGMFIFRGKQADKVKLLCKRKFICT
jgi:transposase